MIVLKNTTDITVNEYNMVKFFKGFFWGLLFVVPFWFIIVFLFI
ncbi:hypothetical protein [Bacillus thuringiensis]|nr:hypothetical protein [Bacillus thuringiensis]